MEWVALLILAVVQGVTEFLPISSSGHLRLGHALLGSGEPDLLLDVVLHVGTLVAVLVVYARDVGQVLRDGVQGLRVLRLEGRSAAMRVQGFAFAVYVALGSVITAAVGLLLKDLVEGALGATHWVGSMLLLNGLILWSARRAPASKQEAEVSLVTGLTASRAALVGLLQGLAVVPGISRSGLTITGALWLGVPGQHAARFSFLLSVPAILGALVLQLAEAEAIQGRTMMMGVGLVVAAVIGALSLRGLVQVLKRARFHHFAWYCWGLGALALVWTFVGA